MRLIVLVSATLLLAACGKQGAEETQQTGPQMTAEAIQTNDVTAIDAVTGQAANMAADVEFTDNIDNSADANAASPTNKSRSTTSSSQKKAPSSATTNEAAPVPATAANTTE